MSAHVNSLIAELALGIVPGDERARLEDHLGSCPECASELTALHETVARLAELAQGAVPSPPLRERILTDASSRLRFAPFTARVAALFRTDVKLTGQLLEELTGDGAWVEGLPGIAFRVAPAGPGLERATATFLRVRHGASFPRHRHLGQEHLLVLQGSFRDTEDGLIARAGDLVIKDAGTTHAFEVPGEPGALDPCVCAYVTWEGVEFVGTGG